MKDKTKLSKIEKVFCERSGKLAHYGCLVFIKRQVPKNRIFETCSFHKKPKTKKEKIYYRVENKYKLKDGRHDLGKALKEKFIRKQAPWESHEPDPDDDGDPQKLSKLFYQAKKSIKKRIEKEYFPKAHTFNRLNDKIENLILEGMDLNDKVSRELQRSCSMYGGFKKIYGDPKKIIEEKWKKASEEVRAQTEALTPEQMTHLRLFKKQQLLKGRRTIKRPKPFDEFSISMVLAAKEKEIITREEARILNYRYGLEGQGTKSLSMIAGLIGVSHTTVRNIENKALKKMKEHMEEIKKYIPIKESIGRDITEEEYKRRFGYYSDLGNK